MKSGTESKLKFKQLQKMLGLSLWEARGLLDTLWNFVANNCPAGDIGRFTSDEIAIGIDYRGDMGILLPTLVGVRWLDECDGQLFVHDWPEHCEDTVHKTLARKTELFADGTPPSLTRLDQKERKKVVEAYRVKYGFDITKKGQTPTNAHKRRETPKNAPRLPNLTIPNQALPDREAAVAAETKIPLSPASQEFKEESKRMAFTRNLDPSVQALIDAGFMPEKFQVNECFEAFKDFADSVRLDQGRFDQLRLKALIYDAAEWDATKLVRSLRLGVKLQKFHKLFDPDSERPKQQSAIPVPPQEEELKELKFRPRKNPRPQNDSAKA